MKIKMTKTQWEALIPAIQVIHSGCQGCICLFIKKLTHNFEIEQEWVLSIFTFETEQIKKEFIEEIFSGGAMSH